jgi:hypothetical protein
MSPVLVYRAYCLAYHDADGSGRIARKAMPDLPDFTDPKWQTARKDADPKKSIPDGKGKCMQPMKDKLSPSDADQMVAVVRAFQGGKAVHEANADRVFVLRPEAMERPRALYRPIHDGEALRATGADAAETERRRPRLGQNLVKRCELVMVRRWECMLERLATSPLTLRELRRIAIR